MHSFQIYSHLPYAKPVNTRRQHSHLPNCFLKDFIYLFSERGREGERGGEKETSMCGCLSHVPRWVHVLQPKYVP